MSFFDTVMSDTVGTVYRAATGKVDPWSQSEINDQAAQAIVQASNGTIAYDQALTQAQADTQNAIDNTPSWWNTVKDNYTGPLLEAMPSWAPWAIGGAGVILLLWVLRPYIVGAEEL